MAEHVPEWLESYRARAARAFDDTPWPTTALEEWKRTDLRPYALDGYLAGSRTGADLAAAREVRLTGQDEPWDGLLRLRDAACVDLALSVEAQRLGLRLRPLAQALVAGNGELESIFARGLETADNRLLLWNLRSWSNGVYLSVPAGVRLARPIHVALEGGSAASVEHPHLVILVGEGAEAEVVVTHGGGSVAPAIWNSAAVLRLETGARLRYAELQDLPPATLVFQHQVVTVAADARLEHRAAVFGGSLHKSRLSVDLAGSASEAVLEGLYFADKKQHLDIMTVQRHLQPGASSRTLYKGAVRDTSTAVFQGLIDVAEGASRTDAYLSNRNLVLSDTARAASLPSLAIRNNDLRCTHGSTTGRIDPEQRFYLMARGLNQGEADRMLAQGFFEEVVERFPEVCAEGVRARVREKLEAPV